MSNFSAGILTLRRQLSSKVQSVERQRTHCDAGAKPRARLRASSTDVVAHS